LTSVACSATNSCVAVGSGGNSGSQTLIESWNGTSWAVTPSPNKRSSLFDELLGVACTAVGCTAAGLYAYTAGGGGLGADFPLIEAQ
jgi:hypothetical protein